MHFLFDANLPPDLAHAIRELCRAEGGVDEVIHLCDKFPRSTPDLQWIPALGQGWYIVSLDKFAKSRGQEREALRRAGHTVYVLDPQWSRHNFWMKSARLEQHRGPGTTAEVEYATRKEPFAVLKSHVNCVVPDSQWERIAACALDTNPRVHSFVKNSELGFAIPYLHSGTGHDYMPDFIVKLAQTAGAVGTAERHVIFETKGFDDRLAEKQSAAERWVNAINSDGRFGPWSFVLLQDRARIPEEIAASLETASTLA